jgi:polyisoprenyl-phosphate glycosyltransferase
MAREPVALSVVCPAFNEAQVLPLFHRELIAVVNNLPGNWQAEIVYVDDGSSDGTCEVLRELVARDSRVRFLSLSRNFGHQAALMAGLSTARGDAVVSLDSDLQHPPAIIPLLLDQWQRGNDVVITIRKDPSGAGRIGRALSRWFYSWMGWLSDTEIRPASADFRLLSRRALNVLLDMNERHPFLRGMVQWLGFPSAEVRYTAAPRAAGQPKYTFRRRAHLAVDGILSFSKTPLRLPFLAGLVTAAVGSSVCGFALVQFMCAPKQSGTLGALAFGSLFILGGSILWSIGILGEYMGRIYDEVRARPQYVVKEESQWTQEIARDWQPPTRARRTAI